jgi:uncharacterized protein RhaS with RHS repeats
MKKTIVLCIVLAHTTFAGVVNYTYDSAGRLTRVDYGTSGAITYSYDKAGNVLSRTTEAGSAPAPSNAKTDGVRKGTEAAPNSRNR